MYKRQENILSKRESLGYKTIVKGLPNKVTPNLLEYKELIANKDNLPFELLKDGYFWYVGRADDLIKTRGYRVGPFEIENVLMKHPAVLALSISAHCLQLSSDYRTFSKSIHRLNYRIPCRYNFEMF